MHENMNNDDNENNKNITHKIKNPYDGSRYIHFIYDVPQLIKTTRNCLYNSGAGKMSRYMWNDGYFLLWTHISDFFYEDLEFGLHLLPKLTYDHIKLTPYSVMNVRLAAQVLSKHVSDILTEHGPEEAKGTAKYLSYDGHFF